MASYNIGPKIGIEGEAEFRKQVSRINQEYKTMQAETRAVVENFKALGDEQGALKAKSGQLEQMIAKQREKMALLEDAVAKAAAQYGESSIEATRLRGVLADTSATVSQLEQELAGTVGELDRMAEAMGEIGSESAIAKEALAGYLGQLDQVDREYKVLVSEGNALSAALAKDADQQTRLASTSSQLERQLELQRKRMELLSDSVEQAALAHGEGSEEVTRLKVALNNTSAAVSTLERELSETDSELERMAQGLDDVGDAAADADDKVLSFGDALKAGIASGAILEAAEEVVEAVVEIGKATVEAAAEVKAENAQFTQTFGALEGAASSALDSISRDIKVSTTRLQGGYTALYAFTKSVGGDQETALDIANRALRAAADSAAYYDRTMEDATETLQSFLKGNYENDAALGIAATETTRNAKANELYAKSFKDLTEAQKVDTLLAMVEAGNAASGALGQAAREAESWANVTGELQEAWRQMLATLGGPVLEGLIPIMQGITEGIKGLTAVSPWEQLNTGVAQFEAGIRTAETALSESNSQIAATSGLAREYVSRLQELEESGLDTAESQREYAQTVELLNALLPDLNLSINKVTGRLDQNTDSILGNIDALQEQIKAQAEQEYYAEIIAQQVAVEKDLHAARLRQSELLARQAILIEQGAVAHEHMSYAQSGSTATMEQFNSSMTDADRELAKINYELTATEGAIRQGEEAVAGYAAQLEAAGAAMGNAGEQSGELAKKSDTVREALAKLADMYGEAKDDARDSIESQIGLFDELEMKTDVSAEKIVTNWGKQQGAFANYSDNLKKAVELGLDEALVEQLADGSQESMLILDEFLNGTSLTIDEINAEFRKLSEAKDTTASAMADVRTAANSEYEQLRQDIENAGKDIMGGAAKGIRNYAYLLEQAMGEAADLGNKAYRMGWDINSPSRVMAKNSDYIIDGAVLQLERRTRDMEAAMRSLAQSGNAAYLQEQLDYVSQYPSMVAGAAGYGSTTNNHSVAYGGISINITTQPGQDERAIANAVVQELTARFGREEASF